MSRTVSSDRATAPLSTSLPALRLESTTTWLGDGRGGGPFSAPLGSNSLPGTALRSSAVDTPRAASDDPRGEMLRDSGGWTIGDAGRLRLRCQNDWIATRPKSDRASHRGLSSAASTVTDSTSGTTRTMTSIAAVDGDGLAVRVRNGRLDHAANEACGRQLGAVAWLLARRRPR